MRHEPTSGYEDSSLNYRVVWKDAKGGEHEEIFTSRDTGWDFYQSKSDATWEFIPAQ